MSTNHSQTNEQSRISQILLSFLKFNTTNTNLPNQEISDSDWEEVLQESIRQQIGGLLYRRLVGISQDVEIPTWVLQTLQQQYAETAFKNMQLYLELHKVLEALHESDIPVIVLKGAYLAQGVYKNIALRSMGDVDILVKKEDFSLAEQLLLDMGFIFNAQYGDRDWYLNNHIHLLYFRPENEVNVELHWDVTLPSSPLRIEINRLWERARPTNIVGVDVLTLSPEDLLLHICIHMFFHHNLSYFGLRSLIDIREILRHFHDCINWHQVLTTSKQLNICNCMYLALRLARHSLNAPVPEEIIKIFEPQDFDPRLIPWVEEWILIVKESVEFTDWPKMSGRFANMYLSQGLINKMSAIFLICFPPIETMANLYSLPVDSKQVYFYYPIRIFGLFQKYTSLAWRILMGNQDTMDWIDIEGKRSAFMDWVKPENQTGY